MMDRRCTRISMWSGPRNISTAIMYSFRQRGDTRVFDEPLYAHYLRVSGVRHPGGDEVRASMDDDGERVIRDVLLTECTESSVRFYKNMAHHLVGLDRGFLHELSNVVLTRDPREMLPSLAVNLTDLHVDQTGLPAQVALVEELEAAGREPVVLDARQVLLDPTGVLGEACDRLGIGWDEAMLTWPSGPKPEDGVWAVHWYGGVHRSTGFAAYRPKTERFPVALEPLLEECLPLYRRLEDRAIRARA